RAFSSSFSLTSIMHLCVSHVYHVTKYHALTVYRDRGIVNEGPGTRRFFVARRRVGVLRWRPPYRKTCKDRDSPSPPVLRLYIRRHTPAVPLPPQPGRGS